MRYGRKSQRVYLRSPMQRLMSVLRRQLTVRFDALWLERLFEPGEVVRHHAIAQIGGG